MSQEALIQVEHVSRFYGETCAVNDISFTVRRGEVLGFLGPNGAGKTTTMQMISGVQAASSGIITIAGYDIIANGRQAKQHLGFLPEQPPLYNEATVDEYLHYCAQLRRMPKASINQAVINCKQRCGLDEAGKRLIGNLSKGYQQRVGIAQAIIHSPSVIVFDEPTSGLDPNQIIEIRQLINELSDDHSIILSTHILSEVQSTCDRVLIINNGQLVLDEALGALHNDEQTRSISIALQQPPPPEQLETIEGVREVIVLEQQRFRVTYNNGTDTPMLLARIAAKENWDLFEMIPEADTLEETFLRLTRGEIIPQLNEELAE